MCPLTHFENLVWIPFLNAFTNNYTDSKIVKKNVILTKQFFGHVAESKFPKFNFSSRPMACSSSLDDSSPSARHIFVLASSSGLRGRRRTYLTILKRAWSAYSKMVG
jgi:hypothetical protein